MSKKIMTVQLGDEEEDDSGPSGISKIVENNLVKPGAEMLEKKLKEIEAESSVPTGPLLSAGDVTKMAIDFFRELGSKYVMPKRVLKEGERNYAVDIDLKGRIASILIDRSTKEIIEYEIKEPRKEVSRRGFEEGGGGGGSFFSPGIIIIVVIMQIVLTVVFNFLGQYVEIPFLTGPPAV